MSREANVPAASMAVAWLVEEVPRPLWRPPPPDPPGPAGDAGAAEGGGAGGGGVARGGATGGAGATGRAAAGAGAAGARQPGPTAAGPGRRSGSVLGRSRSNRARSSRGRSSRGRGRRGRCRRARGGGAQLRGKDRRLSGGGRTLCGGGGGRRAGRRGRDAEAGDGGRAGRRGPMPRPAMGAGGRVGGAGLSRPMVVRRQWAGPGFCRDRPWGQACWRAKPDVAARPGGRRAGGWFRGSGCTPWASRPRCLRGLRGFRRRRPVRLGRGRRRRNGPGALRRSRGRWRGADQRHRRRGGPGAGITRPGGDPDRGGRVLLFPDPLASFPTDSIQLEVPSQLELSLRAGADGPAAVGPPPKARPGWAAPWSPDRKAPRYRHGREGRGAPAGGAGAGGLVVLVVEVPGPAHQAMLIEPPGTVQYPARPGCPLGQPLARPLARPLAQPLARPLARPLRPTARPAG